MIRAAMRRPLAVVAACLGLAVAGPALADGICWAWGSGSVAGGALVDSGVQPTASPSEITCFADNSAGGAPRNFVAIFYADDKTTVLYTSTTAVTNGTQGVIVIRAGATSATGITPVPASPSRWMKFQLAAGGAAAGRLTCVGR